MLGNTESHNSSSKIVLNPNGQQSFQLWGLQLYKIMIHTNRNSVGKGRYNPEQKHYSWLYARNRGDIGVCKLSCTVHADSHQWWDSVVAIQQLPSTHHDAQHLSMLFHRCEWRVLTKLSKLY